ncbi:MAG: tRNA (N6-threonylcarbamoyladenosine(37)-N6)-methyltransferase TrmO [Candidatus Cloacimonadota bacterium]|nr:tRNA (N6-threonylcarbamoyladenosine(37)-N6)-methyltransferase TrmO [Candidatus Cloacimonadota bacterium]
MQIEPIGIIETPFENYEEIPAKGKRKKTAGKIIVNEKYVSGLKDLSGFSHIILLWYFHKSKKTNLISHPPFDNKSHGVFATRSPNRPNHIGMSIVELEKIRGNVITFRNVEMFNNTPLLDIKPYIRSLDEVENAKFGWIDEID